MFQQALLESSPAIRRRNAWPMATAFTLELIVASVLVLLPLISTGVLPLATHVIVPLPPRYTPIETHQPPVSGGSHNGVSVPSHQVVSIVNTNPLLSNPFATPRVTNATDDSPNPNFNIVGPSNGPNIPMAGDPIPPVRPQRIIISRSLEAMLMTKVVPEYPQIARIAGIQGDVKLHAIIAKDGSIQSLTVTSGPDMLREAALRAVQQWKYRPYILDGEAVEVETVITVSFKKSN